MYQRKPIKKETFGWSEIYSLLVSLSLSALCLCGPLSFSLYLEEERGLQ